MPSRAPRRAPSSALVAVALVAILVVAGCALPSINAKATPVAGTGVLKTMDLSGAGFTSISVVGGISLVVATGDTPTVKLAAQENLLPLVHAEIANGQLSASIGEPGVTSDRTITLTVTVPVLTSVSLGAGATGTMELQAQVLQVSLSGGATLKAIGSVGQLSLSADSGAQAQLGDLKADGIALTMGGGSQATLTAATMVSGSADGGASITLTSRPATVNVKTSGGAVVTGG